jgi:putative ABC transport system permease protein
MILKIAWRNIWRNKVRSIVVIASVSVGLFAAMFIDAFFWGLAKQDISNAVETQLSHIQMHNPAFQDDKEPADTIGNLAETVYQLKKDTNVQTISVRVVATGMISSSLTASGVEVHGIVPSEEKLISSISNDMVEGSYFTDTKKNEILIGEKLVEKLGVKLRSKIVLTFQSNMGDLTSGSFRIEGIFRSRNTGFDEMTVFTRFDDLGQLLGTGNGVHEIAIMLKDGQKVDDVAGGFKKQFPLLLVQTWKEIEPEMAILTSIFGELMYIIIGIILLALMFGIINTMLMAVLERQREFGMLMAIGMDKRRVFMMVMLESVMLTCVGIPVGILLTLGTVSILSRHGIDLYSFSKALSQFGFSNIVYPELESSVFLPVILMTALTAIFSGIYPAIKALQLKPAVAIHKI